MKNKNFALIMAGGQGTRFWPYSTSGFPKQFLKIIGNETLILQTFKRLEKIVPKENIFIVANNRYLSLIKDTLPNFQISNFIDEPVARNTAPCLIMSNIFLSRIDKDASVLVVPADHYIPDTDTFARQMQDAYKFSKEKNIITFGIRPDSPHTGYGYIKYNSDKVLIDETEFYSAEEFKEKPDKKTAEEYIGEGNYLWNSGMFVYKLQNFKEFLKLYADYYYDKYLELEKSFENKDEFYNIFTGLRPDSIDYALMEKVKEMKISPAKFIWNDVGSWSSVYDLENKDEHGNVRIGKTAFIDTKNSMVFSTEEKPVAVIGLKDVVIVNTQHGIIVSHKNHLQQVKDAKIKLLENSNTAK